LNGIQRSCRETPEEISVARNIAPRLWLREIEQYSPINGNVGQVDGGRTTGKTHVAVAIITNETNESSKVSGSKNDKRAAHQTSHKPCLDLRTVCQGPVKRIH
jgi:hypothetical protein